MTKNQMDSARYVAHFASCLLKTTMQERSNSVRCKLFHVLTDALAYHRSEIPEAEYLMGLFRETGPFDHDERRFRFAIKVALQLIGRSAALSEISATIGRLAQEANNERVFELCLDALSRRDADVAARDADKRLAVLVRATVAENEINNFLDSLTPKSAERKEFAGMIDKAVTEAVAELREKFDIPAAQ